MTPLHVIHWLWAAWLLSWMIASVWSAPVARQRSAPLSTVVISALGIAGIIFVLTRLPRGALILWRVPDALGWVLVALIAAGFLFLWWARLHLGRLWSSRIVTKQDHRVVDTGPYRLVRHPIYAGIIFCALLTAVAKGTLIAVLGGIVITTGLSIRARIEENFLRAELGADAYDSYAGRVPMLVPRLLFSP